MATGIQSFLNSMRNGTIMNRYIRHIRLAALAITATAAHAQLPDAPGKEVTQKEATSRALLHYAKVVRRRAK